MTAGGGVGRTAGWFLVGSAAGGLSGLFGVGGGVLLVPGLALLGGMPQRRAHATSLAAVIPLALAGVLGFAWEAQVDWIAAGLVTIGSVAGALIGTGALERLPERKLTLAFALLLVVTAAGMFLQPGGGAATASRTLTEGVELIAVGVAAGILAGLFGVGGGVIIVPALVLLSGMPDAIAKGTSLAVIVPTALVGTARNVRAGMADLGTGLAVGTIGTAAAFLAARFATSLDPGRSHALFAALLVLLAARLVFRRKTEGYHSHSMVEGGFDETS